VLVNPGPVVDHTEFDPNVEVSSEGTQRRGPLGAGEAEAENAVKLRRFDFVVQFCWQPIPPSKRHELKREKEAQQQPATQP